MTLAEYQSKIIRQLSRARSVEDAQTVIAQTDTLLKSLRINERRSREFWIDLYNGLEEMFKKKKKFLRQPVSRRSLYSKRHEDMLGAQSRGRRTRIGGINYASQFHKKDAFKPQTYLSTNFDVIVIAAKEAVAQNVTGARHRNPSLL